MMIFYLPTFLPSLKQGAYIRFASQLSMSTFRHATRPIEARTLLGKYLFHHTPDCCGTQASNFDNS